MCRPTLEWMGAYFRPRRSILAYALLLAAVTAAPYALAWQAQGEAWRFSGFLLGVEDGNSYIAKMALGAHGAWAFHPPYTTWPTPPLPVFLLYIGLGKLAAPPALHLQLTVLFHWARLAGVVVWVLAVYDFVGLFVASGRWQRWATVLATAGAGLGWVLLPWVNFGWAGSLCFYSPETYGFLGALLLPHLLWARAFLFWALRRVLTARHPQHAAQAWVFLPLLVWAQPLELVPLAAALGAWWGWGMLRVKRPPWPRRLRWAFWFLVGAGIASMFYALYAHWQPYMRVWFAQSPLPSPAWWQYLLAYGGLAPLAWPGWRRWRRGGWKKALPWLWVLLFPALVYAPVGVQRRLADGVWTAGVILAAVGLETWARHRPRRARFVGYGALALALVPMSMVVLGMSRAALHPQPPMFLPRAEAEAFRALAEVASPGDGVLAAYTTGNALPAWAPVRVIAGLGSESPYLPQQQAALRRFFSVTATDTWRRAFLAQNHLRWVFFGPAERALGPWRPGTASFLCHRYAAEGYAFYEVCR